MDQAPADRLREGQSESEGCVIRAADIHARIGSGWPQILADLGIPESALRNKHGPCPIPGCGGKDRYRFDNKHLRGDYFCNGCGAGDGFKLLQRVYGWEFSEARKQVMEAAGLVRADFIPLRPLTPPAAIEQFAEPTAKIHHLRKGRCAIVNCQDAMAYLDSRSLWPLPSGCALQAHATLEYFEDGRRIGRYPALVADVVDIDGQLVTSHVTYLQDGRKLSGYEPRKILSAMTGRVGCAVRLMPAGAVLGIAEGIETALSAALLDSIPVWAALNTSLLAKFEPPSGVTTLRLYADRDEAGLTAALKLTERLQGRVRFEVRIPRSPANDWNEYLTRNSRECGEETL